MARSLRPPGTYRNPAPPALDSAPRMRCVASTGAEVAGVIAVDWGTTSFRACRLDPGGTVISRVDQPRGILTVTDFPATLRELIGPWLRDGETRVLMCGMVGSRQGWVEAPYLPCPADAAAIARALVRVPFEGAAVWLAPGLSDRDPGGVPEVMRGEETQLLAVLGADGPVCLPGTHTKWAQVEQRAIAGFQTFMTGEVFAALRAHTILGRLMEDGAHDPAAFARGVARAREGGPLLHHLFGVRTLGLLDGLPAGSAPSYLSGLLIGHEVSHAPTGPAANPAPVRLIGTAALCARYAEAIALCGGAATPVPGEPAIAGLQALGEHVEWT